MAMAKKSINSKALQAVMAKDKKQSARAALEWEMACNTNNQRGHVYDQAEMAELYSRVWGDHEGATKICHTHSHNGKEFKHIVVKRFKHHGYIDEHAYDDSNQTGNQLIDEIACWQEFAETEHADLLCPILKYFTSKSDKVSAVSETMQKNVIIIAQKAEKVGDAAYACHKAAELNNEHGYIGENAAERFEKMAKFSRQQGWRDAMNNGGNSGVVFDYAKGCYKAVFIDYAL